MTSLADLLAALDLSPRGEAPGRFRAANLDEGRDVVFGGQLLAQTLVAASRVVSDKEVLSLHCVFARGASPATPLDVTVETVHTGRTFASVTVTTAQEERVCARALALLHQPDPDLVRHAERAPVVDGPADLAPRALGGGAGPWDLRMVGDVDLADPDQVGPAELQVWVRFPGAPDDQVISQALLAYASDGFLIGTALRPHAGVGQSMAHVSISTTVLTQTLSFHEPFHAGQWLLLDQRSTYAGRGRSRGRAEVFSADGRLVASFSQDNLIRSRLFFKDRGVPAR